MWQPLVRHRRMIVVAAAGLVVVSVVTILVDLLGERWVSAIQASTTLLLLLATATYAYLTWRLVRATEDPPGVRLAAERATVESVARSTLNEGIEVSRLRKFFPLDPAGGFPPDALFTLNLSVRDWSSSLLLAYVGLPIELKGVVLDATTAVQKVALSIATLHNAIRSEREDATAESRRPEWSRVRVMFEAERETLDDDLGVPKWEDFVTGDLVAEAVEQVVRLRDAAEAHLLQSSAIVR